ncbi:folliculin [Chrysoperla carnea]|uniref:folliculin n=1 Tax=Chrysoperla carnea TaxID=189513 RepID=UPI001D067AB0|nr:folliculin [Chrysoperla carnea]
MNAIIGVGQFCEIHGPCLVFCTQTIVEINNEPIDEFELDDNTEHSRLLHTCEGCTSIGIGQALISKDHESDQVSYISTQTPRKKLLRQSLKQACVRSLSCEIGGNSKSNDDCTMCYCDGDQGGHTVLCYTWRIPDAKARGFDRCLIIVLLMKDRFMLMSVWPFFIKHIEELVKQLQAKAKEVCEIEQSNGNNKGARIQSGCAPSCAPRSLAYLTGLPTIWNLLHTRFSWILHSAPKILREVPPPRYSSSLIDSQANRNSILKDTSFRDLHSKLSDDNFIAVCHCVTTGIQVVFRGDESEGAQYIQLLSVLLPPGKCFTTYSSTYLLPSECSLLAVGFGIALPKTCADVFRIDMLKTEWVVRWDGCVPEKANKLCSSILKAVLNEKINSATLRAHIQSIILKWQNTAGTLNMAGSSSINNKTLLRTLGVGDEDLHFVSYWATCLQKINNR